MVVKEKLNVLQTGSFQMLPSHLLLLLLLLLLLCKFQSLTTGI